MNAFLDSNEGLQFIVGFLCVWTVVCFAISYLGGWWSLSNCYPADTDVIRKRWRFQSAVMRMMTGYGSCLNFGVTERGLALSILFLFRPGHPPLHIPWEDIEVDRCKPWLMTPRIRLNFRQVPGVPLIIRERLAKELSKQNAGKWDEVFVQERCRPTLDPVAPLLPQSPRSASPKCFDLHIYPTGVDRRNVRGLRLVATPGARGGAPSRVGYIATVVVSQKTENGRD